MVNLLGVRFREPKQKMDNLMQDIPCHNSVPSGASDITSVAPDITSVQYLSYLLVELFYLRGRTASSRGLKRSAFLILVLLFAANHLNILG